ncbi:hypothetical protein QT971_01270 [Microcoleus sp. herbarium19]|uniref:hypothetical protein n=1 Tax=Microcoleus sp. herbarium13 TaxID=3055438 RepID=UPI002FD60119
MSDQPHNITKSHILSENLVILGALRYGSQPRSPFWQSPCRISEKLRSQLGVKICQTFL